MKNNKLKRIVVAYRDTWSSSTSRVMKAIGRAASASAIRQASEVGIEVSYLKDGVIVQKIPTVKCVK